MARFSYVQSIRYNTSLLSKRLQTTSPSASPTYRPVASPVSNSIPATMHAWQAYDYGDVGRMSLNPAARTPHVHSPDLVLVKVNAWSINPIDVHMLAGYGATAFRFLREQVVPSLSGLPAMTTLQRTFAGSANLQSLLPQSEFPLTLGRDFSGTVVKTGCSEGLLVGDEVLGAVWPFMTGTLSECVLVPKSYVTRKPREMSHIEAAGLSYAGLTAYTALAEMCGLRSDSPANRASEALRVLIIGASGGVGIVGTQLCRAWGHHVTVTCPDSHVDKMRAFGANEVVARSRGADLLAVDGPYHVILDCVNETPLTNEHVQGRQLLASPPPASQFVNRTMNTLLSGRLRDAGTLMQSACPLYITLRQPLLRRIDQSGVFVGLGQSSADWLRTNWRLWRRSTSGRLGGVDPGDQSWSNFWALPNPLLYQWSFFRPSGSNLAYMCELWRRGELRLHVGEPVHSFETGVLEAFQRVARTDRDAPVAGVDPSAAVGGQAVDTFGKIVVARESEIKQEEQRRRTKGTTERQPTPV